MKTILLFLTFFSSKLLLAQSFTRLLNTPFEGVQNSSIAFSDIDGDGDNDVLITGEDSLDIRVSKLYINDGLGRFTLVNNNSFEGVGYSSISFSDIDGDNDNDVIITGWDNSGIRLAKLYINNGAGIFNEALDTPFEGVAAGSIAFADIDGDNDSDVLITGRNTQLNTIAKLYTNNGDGEFSEVKNTPFEGVAASSIAFADIDGDDDSDLLITGFNNSLIPISKLYTNNGDGEFSEVKNTPFEGVGFSSIAFSDIDGDNDVDILIAGSKIENNETLAITELFTNNGNGVYTKNSNNTFDGLYSASVAFSDVDNDGDQDLITTGGTNYGYRISNLYLNDGNGIFTSLTPTPFEDLYIGSIAFADVDGDTDQDVLITGEGNYTFSPIAKLYINGNLVSSILDSFNSIDFLIYPNPVETQFIKLNIESKINSSISVEIFDLNGKLIYRKLKNVNEDKSLILDVSSLPKNNYILILNDGNKRGVRKLIIL